MLNTITKFVRLKASVSASRSIGRPAVAKQTTQRARQHVCLSRSLRPLISIAQFRRYCSQQALPPTELEEEEIDVDAAPLSHEEAADLMEENGLIKNDVAYKIFVRTKPDHFANTGPKKVTDQNGTGTETETEATEEDRKASDLVYMDNWLHAALTVVGIITVLDGTVVPGSKVMDLACGNGYMTACLAQMVAPNGIVRAVDVSEKKIQEAKKTLQDHYPDLLPVVQFEVADVFALKEEGRLYDAIHVGGGLSEVPSNWFNLVKPDGCVIAATPEIEPESKETQYMLRKYLVQKEGGVLPINMMFVNFEPLSEPSL